MSGRALLRGANQGLGRLAQAIGGGGFAEQQGYDQAMARETKMAQALAQIGAANANAAFDAERAAGQRVQNEALQRRPSLIDELIAASAGTDMPTVNAFRQKLATGRAPEMAGPPAEGEDMAVKFAPEVASKITQALTRLGPLATNTGDIKADDWAQALSRFADEDLRGKVLGGQVAPALAGATQAAMAGKPLIAPQEFGSVDLFTGKVDDTGGAAQRFGAYRKEQAGAQKANAVQSYAAANASNASAGKYQAEADRIKALPIPTAVDENGKPIAKPKPMPAGALKLQQEELDALGTFSGLNADLAELSRQLEAGEIQLGPLRNLANQGRNFVGASNEQSRNLASMRAKLENMRNAVLLLNKGVQTEGDAQRAMNELMANINDQELVKQRLREIQAINNRAAQLRMQQVQTIRRNVGAEDMDFSPYMNAAPAIGAGAAGRGPKPGTVENGYRFKGGNPADQANWERVP